ncbi:hypothetical protein PIB30_086507, partial [Stylosanthes scabra]|nr:hypothetical protein [Stylosanthes scabra]
AVAGPSPRRENSTAVPPLPCPGAAEAHGQRQRELYRPLFLAHRSVATSRVAVGSTFNEPSSWLLPYPEIHKSHFQWSIDRIIETYGGTE